MAGLKLQAVTKSWDGKTQVIQPLTLDVADGEFIVIVGPSGCGKSTLLRMVAGLERVTSGDIWIWIANVSPRWSPKIAASRWYFRTMLSIPI
ncbi:sn-Glycerol-3-phosphate transport ATP-binding protein [Salmonella enterica subsp. enterica]|nr:sn-Glycerol-3-phosphate transport ATP-binding protein [Salmonella enterica subsp. enterica]